MGIRFAGLSYGLVYFGVSVLVGAEVNIILSRIISIHRSDSFSVLSCLVHFFSTVLLLIYKCKYDFIGPHPW